MTDVDDQRYRLLRDRYDAQAQELQGVRRLNDELRREVRRLRQHELRGARGPP